MKYLLLIVAIFLLLVLQAGLVNQFIVGGDLLLIFAVVSLILHYDRDSWFIFIVSGLLMDFTSGTIDGSMIICMLAVFAGIYVFLNKFVTREPNRLVLFSSVGFATVIFSMVLVLVNKFFVLIGIDRPLDYQYILGKKLLIDILVNAALCYPVLVYVGGLKKIQKKFFK